MVRTAHVDSADKTHVRPLTSIAENVCEAGAACLVTMVQGNLLAVTLAHGAIASRTVVVSGLAASLLVWITRSSRPWMWAGHSAC